MTDNPSLADNSSTVSRTLALGYFDAAFYLETYADVRSSGMDPLDHYLLYGFRENRNPTPWFVTAIHRAENLIAADQDPFVHFLTTNRGKADEIRAIGVYNAAAPSEPAKPLVQPFFALHQQPAGHEVVVFTSIAGSRHVLPSNTTQHPDQLLFADVPMDEPGWTFHPAVYWDNDPKLAVLFHKYCMASFFPDGTKLVWVDSRVSLQTSAIQQVAASLDEADLCLFSHYERDCVYAELEAIVQGGRASFQDCQTYERYLTSLDFPHHAGLYETGAFGTKVSERTRRALRKVFGLCKRYISRDQVTLPLVLADAGLDVCLFNNGRTNLRTSPGVFVQRW